MELGGVLQKSIQFLKGKGIAEARWEAEALLAHGLGLQRIQLYMRTDYPLSEQELERLRALVVQRGKGVPVAHLTGEKSFYKSTFKVGPGVLIPRSDSEVLVEALLNHIPEDSQEVVMDWGSGSGCLGLSLLLERPGLKLIAVDQDAQAVQFTTDNAKELGLRDRVEVLQMPVEKLTSESASVFETPPRYLISNPPYVAPGAPELEESVRSFEPAQALFSEDRGLAHLKSWSVHASENFPALDHMVFEIGYDQAYSMKEFLAARLSQWSCKILKDLGGRDRALLLKRN